MNDLTKLDLRQLQAINRISNYKKIRKENPNFSKNDSLWAIYDDIKNRYLYKKDYIMAGIIYARMYEILFSEKHYEQSLIFLICCLYLKLYSMMPSDFMLCGVDYSEKHIKYFYKEIKKISKHYNFCLSETLIDYSLKKYLTLIYDCEKVDCFKKRILK